MYDDDCCFRSSVGTPEVQAKLKENRQAGFVVFVCLSNPSKMPDFVCRRTSSLAFFSLFEKVYTRKGAGEDTPKKNAVI
jgi:hypothetical protein